VSCVLAITGCGGGGGGGAVNTPIPPSQVYSTFSTKGVVVPWVGSALKDADSSEVLVLATMDEANATQKLTPPTPVFILKANNDGSVLDISNSLFDKQPNYWWVRSITPFIHPETGSQALWFCNVGREIGDPNTVPTIPRTPGVWGEQDGLFVMINGKLVDKTETLPQVIDYTHGCATFNDSKGKAQLVKNNAGWIGPDASYQSILSLVNGKWVPTFNSTWNNPSVLQRGVDSFFAAAGDFFKSIYGGSPVFGYYQLKNNGTSFELATELHSNDLELQGYTMPQGSITGDVNNDGWDDLILVMSADGVKLKPFLSGARLALYKNDGKGNLIYDPNAFKDSYSDNDFGLDLKIIDINFDGFPDIVTHGERYLFGTNYHYLKTEKVFINDGKGGFNLKTIDGTSLNARCNENCQIGTYFLKGKDKNSYTLISNSKSSSERIFYSQIVTSTNQLKFK